MEQQGWAAPDTAGDGAPSLSPRPAAPGPEPSVPPAPTRTAPTLPVPLRPMTLSDLLDGAFAVIKSRPRTVFTIAAAILVPAHVIAAFLQRNLASTFSITSQFNSIGQSSVTVEDSDFLWAYVGVALLALSLFFLGGALGRLVTAWYAGGDLTAGEALAASFRRTPALVAAFLLLLVPKLLGFLVCGIGAFIPVALFALTAPALVVEGVGPLAAAKRSWQLVARRFWMCVLIVAIVYLGSSILNSVIGLVPSLLVGLLPPPFDWIGGAAVNAGVSMIVTTAVVSLSVLLYIDLRIRTEGLDIELGAADAFAVRGR